MEQNSPVNSQIPAQKVGVVKKDLLLSAIIGLVLALFLLPILKQSEIEIPSVFSKSLIIVLPFLSVLGMLAALIIARKIKVIYQVAKFVLVGTLNTFIDWGVLNVLLLFLGVASGPLYSVAKGASFAVAVINSYFWNKFWTFKKLPSAVPATPLDKKSVSKEMLQFFVVSVVGFGLNVSVASLVVNILGPQFGLGAGLWANVGALGGTLVGLVWNFLGYKLIVFK